MFSAEERHFAFEFAAVSLAAPGANFESVQLVGHVLRDDGLQ